PGRAGGDEPGRQRARRDAGGRNDEARDGQRHHRSRLRRPAQGDETRRGRRDPRQRYGDREGRNRPAPPLRPVLHDKTGGGGDRALSTTYGIVKQSDGYIRADSEPGKGSCFRIYLPRVQAELAHGVEKPAVESVRGTETVLVVEDETDVRSLVERVLTEQG